MPRWEPDASERLQTAAFDLFAELGFERATIAEIARRAGLTQRTFFNHFADKREVLFGLSAELEQAVVRHIVASPSATPPLEAVVGALQAAADAMLEERRGPATRRQAIINANPELQERELGKRAALTQAIAAALQERGVDVETALVTAGAGMLIEQTAARQWMQQTGTRPLADFLAAALDALRVNVGAGPGDSTSSSPG